LGAQGGPNGAQVGAKTDPNRRRKRRCNKKVFKIVSGRSWNRLRPILGPSWPNLRASWGDLRAAGGGEIIVFQKLSILFEKSLFRIKMIIMRRLGAILGPLGPLLEASWADLGSSWAPKRPQEGAQDEPKTSPKRYDFLVDFVMRFRCRQRRHVLNGTTRETPRSARCRQPLASCSASCEVFDLPEESCQESVGAGFTTRACLLRRGWRIVQHAVRSSAPPKDPPRPHQDHSRVHLRNSAAPPGSPDRHFSCILNPHDP